MNRYSHMRTNLLTFFVFLLSAVFFNAVASDCEPPREKFVVVLDAGHGGQDPGNRGNGFFEKDIALNIVLSIGAELEKLPDVKVIYTRKTDVFVTLAGRAEIANDAGADLFISVHCNAHRSQAAGTETFVLGLHRNEDNLKVAMNENSVIFLEEDYEVTYDGFNPNSPESYIGLTLMQEEYLDQSILLADLIQKNFTHKLNRVDRGVKQAGFLVLRQTYMPSVLIETGFLTNNSEGSFLNSRNGQGKMSEAIVDAVKDYKNRINLEILEGLAEDPPVQVNTKSAEVASDEYRDVTFPVQLAATGKKIDPSPRNFKGLDGIFRNKEGKLYKYYYGATSSYVQIKELQEIARKKGYNSCFIVAFRNNDKISVNDALKTKMN
ncbi:N-acetylmuramoyl-L-alanine amidase family protein [Salinimicrobium soli]|uniref:N-acetylmuramoyl-L-alanine amidase family protein n=1 Tax=Salinimicrobium soli TaxID=1254399 RepID=UPI003AAC6E83